MGLFQKYRHRMNPTACAIELMKTVGRRIKPPIEPVGQSAFQLSAPTVNKIPFQQPICLATVSNMCYRGLRKKYKHCCYEKDRKTGSY